MAYTSAQINEVCEAVKAGVKDLTDINISAFTANEILNGMTNNATADDISKAVYNKLKDCIPQGTYEISSGTNSTNVLRVASGIIHTELARIDAEIAAAASQEEQEEETPAVTEYQEVTPQEGDNPKTLGWYERSGEEGSYVYTVTNDETVDAEKTYYTVKE